MERFKTHRGKLALVDRANVDTDAIIPKQFLKSIKRTGFEKGLFYDWSEKDKPAKGTSILVARKNFGCGSSREHAVWAVKQFGFKAIISPMFADIFKNNCVKNSLLTIELPEAEVEEIFQMAARYPGLEATIDLDGQRVVLHRAEEISFKFEVEPAVKERLIHGIDDIGLTLKHEARIKAFERSHDVQLK